MTDTQQTQQNMFEIWTQSSNIFASSLSATYSELFDSWTGQVLTEQQKIDGYMQAYRDAIFLAKDKMADYASAEGVWADNAAMRDLAEQYSQKWSQKYAQYMADLRPYYQQIDDLNSRWSGIGAQLNDYLGKTPLAGWANIKGSETFNNHYQLAFYRESSNAKEGKSVSGRYAMSCDTARK